MKKKIRKVSLLCTTAVMACSLVLGAGITALPKTVTADTASMASVIGKKTDNVTVTAAKVAGSYKGLQIGSGLMKEDWSAQIDATFTGNTSISYLLPNMAGNADVQLQADKDAGKVYYIRQGNAFSVRKTNGDLVATFITVPKAWANIEYQSAYFYNAIEDTYCTPYSDSVKLDSGAWVNYWTDPIKYREDLVPDLEGGRPITYLGSLVAHSVAPATGVTSVAAGALDSGDAEGTLFFNYADGVLTIESETYDLANRAREDQCGNGQTIPYGSVNVDLSDGYIIEMHNAPDFGKDGDVNYWDHTCSSSVLLTNITSNGNQFDTLAANIEVTEVSSYISYVGEKVVDEKNVIELTYEEKLGLFDTYKKVTATTNEGSQSMTLNGYQGSFEYANNKEFIADEEITVSNGVLSKDYLVDVVMPSVGVTDLVTATQGTVTVTAAYTKNSVTGLLVDPADKSGDWSADINGTFTGNSSITYALPNMANTENVIESKWSHQGNAFSVKDSNGNIVAMFVTVPKAWASIGGQSAYFYNGVTGTYTMPQHSWNKIGVNEETGADIKADCWNDPMTYYTLSPTDSNKNGAGYINNVSAMKFSPSTGVTSVAAGTLADGAELTGTIYFDYADGVLTVKTSSYDFASATAAAQTGNGNIVVMGTVNVDLSEGYTVMMHNAPDFGNEGDVNYYAHTYSSSVLVTAINGVSTTGATAEATSLTKGVVCDNGAEVAMGEELTFTSNSAYYFDTLTYKGSDEVTVDTADVSKPGATVAIVSDWLDTYEIPLTVKTLGQSFTGVEMVKGGFIRMGGSDDGSDKGLGFKMTVSAADKALIEAYVGEGKAYQSISYGMIIMPYDYVDVNGKNYGDVNAETLFGENAVYTWFGKEGAGEVSVVQMETEKLLSKASENYIFGAITELKVNQDTGTNNVMRAFIGVGYVKLLDANGEAEYVVVSAYSDTSDAANNNIRTAFETAKAVYEDPAVTNEEHKTWLLENYLLPNGYEVVVEE